MTLPFSVSYITLWVLVVIQFAILLGVIHVIAQIQRNPGNGNWIGREVSAFSAADVEGVEFTEQNLGGRIAALLFVSPTCGTCTASLTELQVVNAKAPGNVFVICQAGTYDCSLVAEQYGSGLRVIVDSERTISQLFGITTVPTAVLVDERRVIRSYGQPLQERDMAILVESTRPADGTGGSGCSPPGPDVRHRRLAVRAADWTSHGGRHSWLDTTCWPLRAITLRSVRAPREGGRNEKAVVHNRYNLYFRGGVIERDSGNGLEPIGQLPHAIVPHQARNRCGFLRWVTVQKG